jgi:hypothetical protein
MAYRDTHFGLKVLAGVALTLLVIDAVLLAFVIIALTTPQPARAVPIAFSGRATQTVVEQALILPTHDPRKPWVTRMPLPTATPWLIARATLTPGLLATSGPPGNSALIPSNAAGFRVAPGTSAAAAPATPSPTVEAVRPTGAPGPTLTPPGAVELVVTPTPTFGSPAAVELTGTPTPEMLPTETQVTPADTPSPTPLPDTPEPSPSVVPGDFVQFTAYVEGHYNSIAGQPLEIGAVSLFAVGAGIPVVTVEVIGDGTNSVFAQTPDAALDYGRRLLNDTKLYFDGQPFAISVVSKYDTSDPGACNNHPSWCTVGERNQDNNRWSINWTCVKGTSAGGSDSVQTWNAGQ